MRTSPVPLGVPLPQSSCAEVINEAEEDFLPSCVNMPLPSQSGSASCRNDLLRACSLLTRGPLQGLGLPLGHPSLMVMAMMMMMMIL